MKIHTAVLVAIVAATAILAHLFNPSNLSSLELDIFHSLHGPGFSLVAIVLLWALRGMRNVATSYLIAGLLAIGIGLVSELAQILTTRDGQIEDLIIDTLGIIGALGVVACFDRRLCSHLSKARKSVLIVVASIALGAACRPTIWYSYALIRQHQMFPHLLTLESRWEETVFNQTNRTRPEIIAAPAKWPSRGKIIRARELAESENLVRIYPAQGWHDYDKLVFTAAATEKDYQATVCISEFPKPSNIYNDGACQYILLTTTPGTYQLNFSDFSSGQNSQSIDFSKIRLLAISVSNSGTGRELLLDSVRLE